MEQNIGFIGLGAMGFGMAMNVRKRMDSSAILFVNDVDRSSCERFVAESSQFGSVVITDSAKDMASQALTIFSIVPAGQHVKSVYLDGEKGVLAARSSTATTDNQKRLYLECSTIDIATAKLVGDTLWENGMGRYVDCPVSGGVPAADRGELSLMMGVDARRISEDLARRLTRVSSYFGNPDKTFYCGSLGSGLAAKICNNYLSCTILLANSEAMATGLKLGLDKHVLHRVIQSSTGQNFMADNVCPVPGVVDHAPSSNNYRLGFKAQMLVKDVQLGVDAANSVGIKPSIGEAAMEVYRQVATDERCIRDTTEHICILIMTPPIEPGAVEIFLLDGGGFTSADDTRIHANGHNKPFFLYNWCFYIHHHPTRQKILWDLGLSGINADYTPFVVNNHFPVCNPTGPRRSLKEQLQALDVDSTDITAIIFSHAHWDHCRPASEEFPNAKLYFGPGTSQYCSPGHIVNGHLLPRVEWDARFFGDDASKTEAFEELTGAWTPWGPFELSLDFFGDGSFTVIQAPGHMPGNLAACARVKSGERILLCSDCCHSMDILLGRKDMAIVPISGGATFCLHADIPAARDTIRKLRECQRRRNTHVYIASIL
ncbi:putative 3-hydroxyisobutyrate dehydrogenase, mitochondrial [Seiridium cardinale]|uniref:3-hydroxyisobutyrate dehydrogenase, mitochondrial n=1 Tax=Seiridium cardinale TaxID=138064 RepID=A0ABR2YA86_9PEZI